MNTNADLLNSLKIDRSAPPPAPPRRGLWIGLAVAGAVVLAAGGFFLLRGKDVTVRTAETTAIGAGGGGSTSVLDATGYVVARRMATVSAKVTGRVREVLIEEGQKVEEGQVLARLDPVDAEAQPALSASQLAASQSQIASVQAQLKEAEANAARLSTLVAQ
jgi:multidrug efflux pump subunit AcrA (membrane-fusion protein)